MKGLSLRQPWLWAIVDGAREGALATPKLIENRRWNTTYRGPVLLHAAKGCTAGEHEGALEWMEDAGLLINHEIEPSLKATPRGVFCATARIVGVISPSDERRAAELALEAGVDLRWWMREQYGFMLADVAPLAARVPWRGELGLFNVDDAAFESALQKARAA